MNTTNIARALPTDAFPRVRSSTPELLMHRANSDILCERVFIAITLGMATFLFYVCYYTVRSYGVM